MTSPTEMVFENCQRCEFPILQTKYIAAEDKKWHADCFVCKNCEKPFENGQYFIHRGDVFCEEDYQLEFAKKCDRCGEAITDKCISALDLEWHPECFTCDSCGNTLAGGSFMKKNGRPYCKSCHAQQKFAALALQKNLCNRCKKPILDTMLILKGERYHASHFACAMCKCNLKQDCREFEGKLFCPKCFERVNNPTCVFCQDVIYGRCVTALGKTYHPDHLRCFKCQIMLQDGLFYDHLGEPHCEYHYHDARGDLCGRCFQPATGQVLNAVNHKWCSEHFLCACCDKNLTDTKYVDWDLKPVCKDCYNNLGHDLKKRLDKYRALEAKVEELRRKMSLKKKKGG